MVMPMISQVSPAWKILSSMLDLSFLNAGSNLHCLELHVIVILNWDKVFHNIDLSKFEYRRHVGKSET